MNDTPAYGLWGLVLANSLVFVIFAFSVTRPRTARDWRSFGAFAAFVVALFTEMYGFPLTVYLLSGWLGSRFPARDPSSHDAGHLWHTLLAWEGDPHLDPLHVMSNGAIFGGFLILASAWPVLYRAQRANGLAMTGPYALVRHPQYVGFAVIMLGFLLQSPTLPTLVMFPVMLWVSARLARREEPDTRARFGAAYDAYAAAAPAFLPRLGRPVSGSTSRRGSGSG